MSEERHPLRRILVPLLWTVAGFLLAVLVLVDPFDLHPADRWLLGAAGAEPGAEAAGAEDGQLWTCGMHPQVIQEEPGQCPICHMDLVPLDSEEAAGGDASMDPHAGHDHAAMAEAGAETAAEEVWSCPMHPQIVQDEPGQCPICGMDLVAKEVEPETAMATEGAATPGDHWAGPAVSIDPRVVQNMNVRTAEVERRNLRHPIRTVGYLEYDQERMVSVTTKYSGWVEKVHVNYVGEPVRKGQPLFEIYSPELVQTQQELLSALDFAARMAGTPEGSRSRARALVEAARTRLGYWDVSHEQIAQLERTGEVFRTLTVEAPASGVVMKRMPGLEGMAVKPGMETYHLADISALWLSVEVFEDQMAWIREGTPAEVTFPYFPGETFRGIVRFIEPELSERTRTLQVKIAVPNPDRRLRSGMYATVILEPPAVDEAVTIPSEAVLRTGKRNVAVVRLPDGRFAPRELRLGFESEGWVEVLSGLEVGETVITSAQFLLDSEASLREAIQKMVAEKRGS